MMTLTPNLRKIVCLVTVDLVCLLLVGVPCLLLWLVGKITVIDQNIPIRFKSRRSILSWILLQRRDPAPSLQRLNGPNMGSCCRQLWIANHRLQVDFPQQTNALLFVFSQLKQPNVFPCSLVETSRLKRSATFSWTRFSRYFICIRSTVLLTNVAF